MLVLVYSSGKTTPDNHESFDILRHDGLPAIQPAFTFPCWFHTMNPPRMPFWLEMSLRWAFGFKAMFLAFSRQY
jgi:hypothetical protein